MKKNTLLNKAFITLVFLLVSLLGVAQSQTFATAGANTFTVPAGVTSVTVEAWGGGGRGGERTSGNNVALAGGGGGAYAKTTSIAVTSGSTYNLNVGAGSTSTSTGGDSWFINTSTILAKGGSSVGNDSNTSGAGGQSSASIGTTKLNGGNGGTGTGATFGGGGGSSAGTVLVGNYTDTTTNSQTGATAPTGGGNGGKGAESGTAGINGVFPGGGGGGGYRAGKSTTENPGNGANGQVIISWTCPTYSITGTSIASPLCTSNGASVTLAGGAGLPVGNYTVSYTLTGANTGSSTATMSVTTAGTGNFTTTAIANAGLTNIQITNLSSGVSPNICTNTITTGNTASVTLNSTPTITGTTPGSRSGTGTVTLTASASSGTISWFANSTGGSALGTGTSYTTPSISNTTTYYVETNNGTCTSTTRVAVVATVNQPEINIKGNNVTIVDGAGTSSLTDHTLFLNIDAIPGSTSTRTFTILNTGAGTLNLSGTPIVQLSNTTNFTVTALPSSTVAATSGTTTFTIEFNSLIAGTFSSNVTIANNDPNEAPYNFVISGTAVAPITNGPGGVLSNLQLWLRSDLLNGTTSVADNTTVNTWNTQARGTDAIKPTNTGAPVYKNNPTANINFNSVVDFTNDYTNAPLIYTDNDITRQYLKGTSGFYSQDMFVVLMPDIPITSAVASNDIFCGDRSSTTQEPDATGIGYGAYTARFSGEVLTYAIGTTSGTPPAATGYGVANVSPTASYSVPGIINARNNSGITGQELYFNANNNVNTTNEPASFVNVNNSQYWIGRSEGWTGSLDGRVGEIITYSSRLTDIQRSNVQSYLAVKYGITLGVNGTSMNYTNSDGNVIWNVNTGVPANDVFNYDIAGIGRDDIAKLNQKQSKTVNTNGDITIGLTDIAATNTANTNTFDSDKKFLIWGNNHATLAAQPAVTVNMSTGITPALTTNVEFVSVGRTWKVVETGGNVGTTKVSIPTLMLSATLTPPGDYLMFISSTPNFDPTAEYRIMSANGSNLETSYDFDGTKYITFGFAPERTFERSISFDGSDDYLDAGKVLDLNTSFTVSAWIKSNGSNQTILSKRDNPFTTGYDLSINSAGKAEMSWFNGTNKKTITSTVVIPTGKWHNIAVTYGDGTTSTAKLYIDGVLDRTETSFPSVTANNQSFLIAAADGVNTTSYFNGGIDEVRVWSVALKEKELRYVMNQEILSNGLATNGKIIPNTITLNDISPIPWSNLSAYYPMSTYTYTNAKDISMYNHTAALRNLTTVDLQTAPLPYKTTQNGDWQTPTTWLNNEVQDLPNSLSPIEGSIDWNIVETSHNVTSTGNKTVLGLMVNSNTITASTNTKIEVTNYLKLDGKIDLVGMSQLIQTLDCDLDVTSKGSIERDQQGQANKYNYNYWSSPVSPITLSAPFANNNDYTVAGIMKDGTNPASPEPINWIGGYDGATTTPISIARYWLYTFDNKVNAYANWNKITESSLIRVGLGFTMKGSGTTGTQNYTFVGKPNNGLIDTNTVGKDQLLLTGNPYPSALDAKKFINDNAGSIDGTLYFWEHYSTNNSHVLKDYQGGYATLNLVGGVATGGSATSADLDPTISSSGSQSKGAPKQDIPVGQGFFVNGSAAGGPVVFNNNQRIFVRESDADSNILYKTRPKTSKTAQIDHWNDNSNDTIQKDNYKRIRLGFNSNNNYHRQVLLGFMNEKATSGMDYGYDGISLDEIPNDMYFLNGDNQLVIQGEGYFNEDASYPIGVKTDVEGKVTFTIDALENFDAQQKIYIYDDETKTYNEIQKSAFEVTLPAGINDTRFSLRFKDKSSNTDKTLTVEENKTNTNEIKIAHIQNSNSLVINNSISDVFVLKVTLFNINGQSIANWKIENQDQQNIQIPINKISSGVYIVKLKTTTGELSKKLIVK